MKEDILKKIQELAKSQKLRQDDKSLREEKRIESEKEIISNTLNKFDSLENSILKNSEKIKNALSASNDTIKIYSNEIATNKDDKDRKFTQLLYYVQGTNPDTLGVNTPSILFEAIPSKGNLRILTRTSIKPSPLEVLIEEPIENFDEDRINNFILDFIENMLTRNT